MNIAALDTLDYSKRIQLLGMTREQAEGFAVLTKEREAALLAELERQGKNSRTDLATRSELFAVRDELKGDNQNLRSELYKVRDELKSELYETREELKGDNQNLRKEVADMKHEILKWMMGMFVALAGVIVAGLAYIR